MQNIVLDLDQTLVNTITSAKWEELMRYAIDNSLIDLSARLYRFDLPTIVTLEGVHTTNVTTVYGIIRPHAKQYIDYCGKRFFKKIIWSAGTYAYVHKTVEQLFDRATYKPDAIFTRDDCIRTTGGLLKSLRIVYDTIDQCVPGNTFLLDDKHDVTEEDMCNQIRIPEFHPDRQSIHEDDRCLLDTIKYFNRVDVRNTRNIRALGMSQKLIYGYNTI